MAVLVELALFANLASEAEEARRRAADLFPLFLPRLYLYFRLCDSEEAAAPHALISGCYDQHRRLEARSKLTAMANAASQ